MHNRLPNIFIFLDKYENNIFKNNNTNIGVIYRNYSKLKKEKELIKIVKACKQKRYPLFISNDIKLALRFRANGIYVPAFNKKNQFSNLENKNWIILGSAHNQKEIHEKIEQKCKGIFLSPLFYMKKSNYFLGTYKFNFLAFTNNVNFFALGGINKNNIRKLNMLHIKGFAGISMFKKKTGPFEAGFLKNKIF